VGVAEDAVEVVAVVAAEAVAEDVDAEEAEVVADAAEDAVIRAAQAATKWL